MVKTKAFPLHPDKMW